MDTAIREILARFVDAQTAWTKLAQSLFIDEATQKRFNVALLELKAEEDKILAAAKAPAAVPSEPASADLPSDQK